MAETTSKLDQAYQAGLETQDFIEAAQDETIKELQEQFEQSQSMLQEQNAKFEMLAQLVEKMATEFPEKVRESMQDVSVKFDEKLDEFKE